MLSRLRQCCEGAGAGGAASAASDRQQEREGLWGASARRRRPGLLCPICCEPESLLGWNPRTQLYACLFDFLRASERARMEGRGGAGTGSAGAHEAGAGAHEAGPGAHEAGAGAQEAGAGAHEAGAGTHEAGAGAHEAGAGTHEAGAAVSLVDAPQQTDRCSSTQFTTANSSFAEDPVADGACRSSGAAGAAGAACTVRPASLLVLGSVYALLLHSSQVGHSSRAGPLEPADCCASSAGSAGGAQAVAQAAAQTAAPAGAPASAPGGDMCRICFGGESVEQLVRPCLCRGSIACVHRGCLERWLLAAASSRCELCRHHFLVRRSHKWGWARALAAWARAGGGRALAEDAWRGAALAAASLLGTARALHACDRLLQAGARRSQLHALAANLASSLLIGLIGALNGLLTTWVLLKIQDYQVSWQRWRASTLHVRVVLPDDAPTPPATDVAAAQPALPPAQPSPDAASALAPPDAAPAHHA